MKATRLDHLNLTVRDFEETAAWYGRVFGFEVVERETDERGRLWGVLRAGDALPASAGIEYAAQAVALHAALRKEGGGPAGRGFLAVLSDVRWTRESLDDLPAPLVIRADLLADTGGGLQYRFEVGPAEGAPVIEGTQVIAKE